MTEAAVRDPGAATGHHTGPRSHGPPVTETVARTTRAVYQQSRSTPYSKYPLFSSGYFWENRVLSGENHLFLGVGQK